jgi:hypothetical protein
MTFFCWLVVTKTSKCTWFLNFKYIILLFGKIYPIEKRLFYDCTNKFVVSFIFLSIPCFHACQTFIFLKMCAHFSFMIFTLCSFFSCIVHLSLMIVNVGVLFELFSVDYSFKACCCYYFLASHDTSPPTKPLQPSHLFIYTSTFLAPCFSFALYIVVDMCTSYFIYLFIHDVFLL